MPRDYSQTQQRGPASAGFQGSNIYSLAAGMYPILADDTHVGGLSTSAFSRQAMSAAPTIYNVLDDNQIGSTHRKPYLQGNFIMQTEATGDVATIRAKQEEEQLLPTAGQYFPSQVRSLMLAAQASITRNQLNVVSQHYATIQSGGRSAEEMTQPGSDFQFVPAGQTGLGEGAANQPDLYNPITNQYVNVTQTRLDSVGHGVYGTAGKNMITEVAAIRRDMTSGAVSMETGYDAITESGLAYFQSRARNTWNPMIANAREGLEISGENTGGVQRRMGRMRELILRGDAEGQLGSTAAIAGQVVSSIGATHFASVAARTMTGQHLGNRRAMFSGGMLETYPIGPYVFAWYGPFRMRSSGTRMYEYYASKIDGGWMSNYNFSSPSENITAQSGIAASDARLRHAAWVTKSHDSGARRATIGAITTGAIFGYTSKARRLRPHVDLINASEQMSDAIDDVVQRMSSLRTVPPELMAILRNHTSSFQVQQRDTMNKRNIWAAPYLSIFGQQYATGTPI